jgi:hypothetical protein
MPGESLAVPAFPGAEGYGASTAGGRGGEVFVVRNLCDYRQEDRADWLANPPIVPSHCNDPNAKIRETFRWAASEERDGPRTVVFDVGGEIILRSDADKSAGVQITSPDLTIAGQTAPSPGITLRNDPDHMGLESVLDIRTHDVIVRHLRIRPGAGLGWAQNHAVYIRKIGGTLPSDIILDHVSASWATDDTISIQDATDVTVQWSIISEALVFSEAQFDEINETLCAAEIPGCFDPNAEEEEDPCIPCSFGKVNNGKGMLIDSNSATEYTGRISVHHNLFVHNFKRTPYFGGGAREGVAPASYPIEVINNVIHDFAQTAVMLFDAECDYGTETCPTGLSCTCGSGVTLHRKLETNVLGNTFSQSEATLLAYPAHLQGGTRTRFLPTPTFPAEDPWIPRDMMLEFSIADTDLADRVPAATMGMEAYIDGNVSRRRDTSYDEIVPSADDDDLPLCTHGNGHWYGVFNCDLEQYVVDTPFAAADIPVTVQSASAAEADVLADAGALYRASDAVDLRVVDDAEERDGTMMTDLNPSVGTITPSARAAGYDDDEGGLPDGMADSWEAGFPGGDLTHDADDDEDGYTNLEEFLNGGDPLPDDFVTPNNANDGSVRESSETSSVGGSKHSTGGFKVGDSTDRTQWMAVLSFDTAALPDTANILRAEVVVQQWLSGGNVAPLGALVGDVKTGTFGSATLEESDFQSAADATAAVTLTDEGGGVYSGLLDAAGIAAINRTGKTEVRLRFTVDDDNDSTEDSLIFYDTTNTPTLRISIE